MKNFTGAGLLRGFDATKIGFGTADMLGGFAGQWRRSLDALILAEFARLWGDDPLWFLIRELSPLEVPELIGRDPAEVHKASVNGSLTVLSTPASVNWRQAVPPLIVGFEGALYAAALDEVFALRLVFGGRGNAFRHGRPETPAREQTLLAIVAIIGWIDSALDTHGTERLAEEIRKPLARNLVASEQRPELNPA